MSGPLKKFIIYSTVAHLIVALLVWLNPDFGRLIPKKTTKVTWVKLSKGTGENPSPNPFKKAKDMPESTLREQKQALKEIAKDKKGDDQKTLKAPVKPKVKPEVSQKKTSPTGGIDLSQKKPQVDTKIDDALARIEQQLQKREVEIEAAQIKDEGTGQSPQGSLEVTGEVDAILAKYVSDIIRKVQTEWITTPKSQDGAQTLKAQITVNIDAEGNLLSTSFESKSGDESFDLSAMRAVERSAPFPPPPAEIKDEVVSEGFLIEFSPRSVVGGA